MLGRPTGTGTRTLLDRLLLDAGVDPDAVSGPTVELHLDVALAVATGEADAGLGLRSAATALGLDFVPLSWEPFQVATTREHSRGVQPLLDAPTVGSRSARSAATTSPPRAAAPRRAPRGGRAGALGGSALAAGGEVIDVAWARGGPGGRGARGRRTTRSPPQ